MSSIIFAQTCTQSNVHVLLVYAKNLIFALFAEFQPIAIAVHLSSTDSVTVRSQHRKINIQNGFFSLELFATLMKAGGDSDNVLIQAPVPVPFLDTKRKWKHSTDKKQQKLQKFALLKILIDLN